jgi:DHA1 family tetracycline resistance protein-like MFS transporter
MAHSVSMFAIALVPLALGIGFGHPTVSSLVSLVAKRDEQGRVQGAASGVESLGRTVGPVWGNASLQQFGEASPYLSAAALLVLTIALTLGLQLGNRDGSVAPLESS